MSYLFEPLLSPSWLMPHGQCYLWNPQLVGLHALSDSLIALAYYSIPLTLTVLVRQRQDLPFTRIFWLFASFIVACGTNHLVEVWTIWHPAYWISGILKSFTATISLYTALALIPVIPEVIALPSPSQLASINGELKSKIEECQIVESQLQILNRELEIRVEERTLDLQRANISLMQYARQQQFIAHIGHQALAGTPFLELLSTAVMGVVEMLKVDHGYILEVLPEQQVRLVAQSDGIAQAFGLFENSSILDIKYTVDQNSEVDFLLSTSQPVVIVEVSQDSRFQQSRWLQEQSVHSGVSVQIPGQTTPFGILSIWSQTPRQFTPDEVDFIQAIVVVLATAIEQQQTKAALRCQEERLRLALDNSPIAMFSQDLELRYNWLYNPQQSIQIEDWIGKTDLELMGSDNAHIIELKQQVLATGSSMRQKVSVVLNEDIAVYDMILEPLQEDEEVVGLMGVAVNITELQVVERLKDEFLSMVSHELRTPLSSLHGSLTLLATGRLGKLEPKGQKLLEIAARNTERLSRLVSDILDLERLESGKLKIEKHYCYAADLILQAMATMRSMADEAGVLLVSCVPQTIQFQADPDRLLQVLTNLLSNAIKFSARGSQVNIEVQYEWDTHILFTVKDEGRGIPKDKLESIFERFQQVDASDARLKGGTGLGLSICRSIIRQHGGTMWVKSELGKGSTFFFSLPLDQNGE